MTDMIWTLLMKTKKGEKRGPVCLHVGLEYQGFFP